MKCLNKRCEVELNSIEQLKLHMKDVHNMKNNDKYVCPQCEEIFYRSDNFYRHYKKHTKVASKLLTKIILLDNKLKVSLI